MSEGIVGGAIRGLGAMFKLRGNIFSPQGIELDLPLQPVSDVTQLGRYGASQGGADGWFVMRWDDGTVGAAVSNDTIIWSEQDGMPTDDDLLAWIYSVNIQADFETAITEVGMARLVVEDPDSARHGPGTKLNLDLWMSDNADQIENEGQGTSTILNRLPNVMLPMPWVRGERIFSSVQGLTAAKTINWEFLVLIRLLPRGIPPLP